MMCIALMSAGAAPRAADWSPIQSGLDYHSFANTDQFRITHVDLDLRVDFDSQTLRGQIGMRIDRVDPGATQLVLDTRDLIVHAVTQRATNVLGAEADAKAPWVDRPFRLDKADPILGSALVIDLPPSRKAHEFIRIDYETGPRPRATGWLTEKQTAGHRPLMYALPGPIAARSWLPLQDTPQVRFTYKAVIHTPEDLRAVMSPAPDPKAKRTGEYSFVMDDAVPAAALGLVAGDLEFKEISPHSGVYAEKPLLRASAAEFADFEAMQAAAQALLGARPAGRFDIVVVGSHLPIAAASAPRMIFVSSTLLAGDKSLLSPAIGALADAWSLPPAAWRDAWVGEGLDRYAANRILGALYGSVRANIDQLAALEAMHAAFASRLPADQALALDLRGRDPGLAVTAATRVKAGLLFTWLESRFGRDRLDGFLRDLISRRSGHSLTTEEFLGELRTQLLERYPGIAGMEEVMAWVSGPGLPRSAELPPAQDWGSVDAVRAAWLAGAAPLTRPRTADWIDYQWGRFLDGMPSDLGAARMLELERALPHGRDLNPVVGAAWYTLVARSGYPAAAKPLEKFLLEVGRGSLLVPLYRAMQGTPAETEVARRVFARARPGYHPQVAAAVDAIVKSDPEKADDE